MLKVTYYYSAILCIRYHLINLLLYVRLSYHIRLTVKICHLLLANLI